jgi:Isochorismatase family
MNAFEDQAVEALKNGYDAMFVTDAVDGRSQTAHRTGIERLAHAAGPALEVIHWHFLAVSELPDEVGVAETEMLAAQAQGAQ